MTKSLFLVRHAKTQQDSIDGRDFTRQLADRGLRDASMIGSYFKENGYAIDMLISSPAARAIATAELIADQIGFPIDKIHTNEELYMASVRTFLQVVNQLRKDWDRVMISSHNPAVTYLAEYLSGADIGDMPTSGIAEIKFAVDTWAEVAQGSGDLGLYITPRMIKDGAV